MANKNKIGYFIGGAIIVVLLIIVLVMQIQNSQKNSELESQMKETVAKKEFCDTLKISIGAGGVPYGEPAGVNYCFASNKDTTAKAIVTLTNGRQIESEERLQADSCMLKQIMFIAGYSGHGYNQGVNCKDIKSIELISTECPTVKDIVTDTSEITCGI